MSRKNLKILKGDEKERACARAYERTRSLEAELLAVQNPCADPSVANEHISKSDELERIVRDTIKFARAQGSGSLPQRCC